MNVYQNMKCRQIDSFTVIVIKLHAEYGNLCVIGTLELWLVLEYLWTVTAPRGGGGICPLPLWFFFFCLSAQRSVMAMIAKLWKWKFLKSKKKNVSEFAQLNETFCPPPQANSPLSLKHLSSNGLELSFECACMTFAPVTIAPVINAS